MYRNGKPNINESTHLTHLKLNVLNCVVPYTTHRGRLELILLNHGEFKVLKAIILFLNYTKRNRQ
jgi:hypothetical protein